MLKEKIQYKKLERVTTAAGRKYVGDDGIPVPSVTTVLDKTSDKTALIAWRKRVGEQEANRVSKESAGLGTKVHNAIEKYILGEEVTFGNNMVSVMAKDMSELMINEGFTNIDEVWGTEVGLIAPGLYAGTTDCVGMHNGEEAIIDFKTSKKIKKEEWIEDYYLQLGAYSLAHNVVYNSRITQGIVLLCTVDNLFQDFRIQGTKLEEYQNKFLKKVEQFYYQKNMN